MREVNHHYYLDRFLKHGEDVRSLWGSRESQEARFAVLCRIGALTGTSVLDVGCGFGDFYGYVQRRKIHLSDYLGLDCVEETLGVARNRYPTASFENRDLLQLEGRERFDWAIGSGLFTLASPEWNQYVTEMTRKMFSLVGRGVGVNFLSSCSPRRDGISHYAEPGEVLRLLACEVSPIIELIQSYRPNDFTVFLYKEFQKPGNA